MGCPAAQPEDRRGLGAEGRLGAVPLVSCRACRREVLPGDLGPGRTLACCLCSCPRTGCGAGKWPGRRNRSRCGGIGGPLYRGSAACPQVGRPATPEAAATRAQVGPGAARIEPSCRREARHCPAANPGRCVRQKAGLNRGILASGWGVLVRRLEQKAPGRVQKISPAFTSQCCSACGRVDPKSRESQAVFQCTACGYTCNADVNAARNIAAGHAVTARGGDGVARPVNREPQLLAS
jgi:hypothetical protein